MDNQSDSFLWIINGILSAGNLLWSCKYMYKKYKKRWIRITMIGIFIITTLSVSMQILNFPNN